jgi:hypothetical protein
MARLAIESDVQVLVRAAHTHEHAFSPVHLHARTDERRHAVHPANVVVAIGLFHDLPLSNQPPHGLGPAIARRDGFNRHSIRWNATVNSRSRLGSFGVWYRARIKAVRKQKRQWSGKSGSYKWLIHFPFGSFAARRFRRRAGLLLAFGL